MEIGDYVRTNYGIARIIDIVENPYKKKTIYELDKDILLISDLKYGEFYGMIHPFSEDFTNKFDTNFGDEKQITKFSSNIIDLIEKGDHVNGLYVINKPFNQRIHTEFDDFFEEDIRTIVTKEQMKSIQYEVR